MNIKTILVAYDGSEPADQAYASALDLASKYGAEVRVLAVAQPPEVGDEVETEALIDNRRRHYRHIFKRLQAAAQPGGPTVHFEVAVGHPAEQIVLHAEKLGADLILMGHRGNSLLSRWLVGSVVKQVIVHAPCALMVVR